MIAILCLGLGVILGIAVMLAGERLAERRMAQRSKSFNPFARRDLGHD